MTVTNLRLARKRKAREQAARQAAENRARHGRTLAQKQRDAALEAEARERLDRLKLDPPPK